MNKPQNNNRMREDKLAQFTDQILEEGQSPYTGPFTPEPEQRALEQTVVRLKNAFHEDGPSEAVIQRMRHNILTQWKNLENRAGESYWKKFLSTLKPPTQSWQPQRIRQRWSTIRLLATVAALLLISFPLLNKIKFDQPAASGQNLSAGVLAAAGALILLAFWFFRRRP